MRECFGLFQSIMIVNKPLVSDWSFTVPPTPDHQHLYFTARTSRGLLYLYPFKQHTLSFLCKTLHFSYPFALMGLVLAESRLSVSVDGVWVGGGGWRGNPRNIPQLHARQLPARPLRSDEVPPLWERSFTITQTSLGADFYSRCWILFVSLLSEATAQILFETLLYLPQLLNSAGCINWNNAVYLATLYVLFLRRVYPLEKIPLNRY